MLVDKIFCVWIITTQMLMSEGGKVTYGSWDRFWQNGHWKTGPGKDNSDYPLIYITITTLFFQSRLCLVSFMIIAISIRSKQSSLSFCQSVSYLMGPMILASFHPAYFHWGSFSLRLIFTWTHFTWTLCQSDPFSRAQFLFGPYNAHS